MAQVIGIVDATWKGKNIPCEKGAKFKPGGIKNNPVTYGRRVDRAQEFVASEITIVTNLRRGEKLSDLYQTGEGELQIICDTGQTFVFGDAFLTDRLEATGGEGGKLELKFAASEGKEILRQ